MLSCTKDSVSGILMFIYLFGDAIGICDPENMAATPASFDTSA